MDLSCQALMCPVLDSSLLCFKCGCMTLVLGQRCQALHCLGGHTKRWEEACTGWESPLLECLRPDTDVPPEPEGLERPKGRRGTGETPGRPGFDGSGLGLAPHAPDGFGVASLQHWHPGVGKRAGTRPLPSVLPLGCAPAGSRLCLSEQADVLWPSLHAVLCPAPLLLASRIQQRAGQQLLLRVPVRLGWAPASASKQPAPEGSGTAGMRGWSLLSGKGWALVGGGWLGRSPLEPAASWRGMCCTPRPARLALSPAAPQLCGVASTARPGCRDSQAQDGMALGSCAPALPASAGTAACTLWGCRVPPPGLY